MRKSMSYLLCCFLLASISLKLCSQSAEQELDQVELMKQFIGTWQGETGIDSAIIITYEPFGDGIVFTQENLASGSTYWSAKGVIGVSSDKKTIMVSGILKDGSAGFQNGKFESSDKCVQEFYTDNGQHSINVTEFVFQSPDVITVKTKYRGERMTWDAEWTNPVTFRKIK